MPGHDRSWRQYILQYNTYRIQRKPDQFEDTSWNYRIGKSLGSFLLKTDRDTLEEHPCPLSFLSFNTVRRYRTTP